MKIKSTKFGAWQRAKRGGLLALALFGVAVPVTAQSAPQTANAVGVLGPENAGLSQLVGVWDVQETVWATPKSAPVTTKSVAERVMIGAFLQETLRPTLGSTEVFRMDYLSFNRVEGRWKYVSMDMRAPVGIMSAHSFGRGAPGRIDIDFDPFALLGEGQLLQMKQYIIKEDANHERKDQRFIVAGDAGQSWLAHRYAYTRRATKAQ